MEHENRTFESTSRPTGGSAADPSQEFRALQVVIGALQPLSPEARARIFDAAGTFLQIASAQFHVASHRDRMTTAGSAGPTHPGFSQDRSMPPKEFLLEKQPRTDVERLACLAYYLTHYRDMLHFKTLDLSKLNTEAAQPKFSNAANSVNNAVKRGYLVPATKGQRQLSAAGEQFVHALPDRDAAREAMATARPKRSVRRARLSSNNAGD